MYIKKHKMKYCKLSFICNDIFSGCWVMIKLKVFLQL